MSNTHQPNQSRGHKSNDPDRRNLCWSSDDIRSIFFRIALLSLVGLVSASATANDPSPVDRFLSGMETDSSIPVDAAKLIRDSWTNCQDCDGDEFLTQALALMSPGFREALDAFDEERYDDCTEIAGAMRSDANPFLSAHATAYEIKAMVSAERLLEAGERIEALLASSQDWKRFKNHSYQAAEIAFLRGFCLLSDLQYEQAKKALSEFLETYPDASQRLRVAARQMQAELSNRRPENIGEVVDLMHFSGRRLTHGDTGETVRTRQQRVLDILDQLIEEAEKQESSSSSSSSGGGGGKSGGSPGQNKPSNPMKDSSLPGGEAGEDSLRASQRVKPGESWGAMAPAERERILQALRDNFPARYRQLVEQYYEQLAKKP
jgi:tetratricopeptide (TPR) repeat protein